MGVRKPKADDKTLLERADVELNAEEEYMVNQFGSMGISFDAALRMTKAHISWHEAQSLVGRGCPADLVERILL